jgi:hypothetical protein
MNNLDYLVVFSRQKANKALAFSGRSLDTAFVDENYYLRIKKKRIFFIFFCEKPVFNVKSFDIDYLLLTNDYFICVISVNLRLRKKKGIRCQAYLFAFKIKKEHGWVRKWKIAFLAATRSFR